MLCTLIGAIILSLNILVGLNMHLYDDIGDASSSFRGSTSSTVHCQYRAEAAISVVIHASFITRPTAHYEACLTH